MMDKQKLYDIELADGTKFQTTYEEGWNILKAQEPGKEVVYIGESSDTLESEDWYQDLMEEFE